MLVAADLGVVSAGILVVSVTSGSSVLPQVVLLPVWIVLAKLYGLYDSDHRALRHLTVDELPTLIAWSTTGAATQMLVLSVISHAQVSTGAAVTLWASVSLASGPLRAGARSAWRWFVPPERAVVLGSGPLEAVTRRKFELFADLHISCVASVNDRDVLGHDRNGSALAEIAAELVACKPERLIVCSANVTDSAIAELVRTCRSQAVKLSVVPPARGMFGTTVRLRHVADLPLVEYSTCEVAGLTLTLKRVIDVVVSAVALVVLAPLLALVAVAVRLDGPGPIFFIDRRAGRGGRPFKMLKFRTMVADAQRRLNDLIDLDELADPVFKLRGDPRVTTVGRFLRRTSMDELPQLLNVLRGEMSLVGPRPEQLELVERYGPQHQFRLALRPGLTGPMQVYGRGELTFEERLAVEREYVENLSLRRDLRMVLLTIAAVVRGKGAF